MYSLQQLKQLFSNPKIIRFFLVTVGRGSARQTISFSLNGQTLQGFCIDQINGNAIAMFTDSGQWLLKSAVIKTPETYSKRYLQLTKTVLNNSSFEELIGVISNLSVVGYIREGFFNYPIFPTALSVCEESNTEIIPIAEYPAEYASNSFQRAFGYYSMTYVDQTLIYCFGSNFAGDDLVVGGSPAIDTANIAIAIAMLDTNANIASTVKVDLNTINLSGFSYDDVKRSFYIYFLAGIQSIIKYQSSDGTIRFTTISSGGGGACLVFWDLGLASNLASLSSVSNCASYLGFFVGFGYSDPDFPPIQCGWGYQGGFSAIGGIVLYIGYANDSNSFSVFIPERYLKGTEGLNINLYDLIFTKQIAGTVFDPNFLAAGVSFDVSDLPTGQMPPPLDSRYPILGKDIEGDNTGVFVYYTRPQEDQGLQVFT